MKCFFSIFLTLALLAPSIAPLFPAHEKHSCSCSMEGENCSCCSRQQTREPECKPLTCQEKHGGGAVAIGTDAREWALVASVFRLPPWSGSTPASPAPASLPPKAEPRPIERPPRPLA